MRMYPMNSNDTIIQKAESTGKAHNFDSDNAVKELFNRWNAALQTGNPDRVAALYADDAILLPTVSNRIRHNRKEITDYFRLFLQFKPAAIIDELNIRYFGEIIINSGIYTFSLFRNDCWEKVQARYTFIYRKSGNEWLIAEQHSSAMPEPLA